MAANWRVRPPVPLEAAVADIARREGRSVSATLLRLVREALAARGRLGKFDPLPEPLDLHEIRRRTVTIRSVTPELRATIKRIGREEDRSASSMARRLLLEALRARGVWPPLEKVHAGTDADEAALRG